MDKITAIVLSAGKGSRMQSDIPKQYMLIDEKPVIYYSLKAFEDSMVSQIVLVTGKGDVEYCKKEIVEKYGLKKVVALVEGGAERYDSVFCGLMAAENSDYVLIHDGARPMIDQKIINDSIECVRKTKACVVGMPVKDTIKISNIDGYAVDTPDRKMLWSIQTPQSFSYALICEAYKKLYGDIQSGKSVPPITDDAMVVEYGTDVKVKLIEGSYQNIKITTPEDICIADIFLKNRK